MKRFRVIFLTVLAIMTVNAPAFANQSAGSGNGRSLLIPGVIGAVMSAGTLVGMQQNFRALYLSAYDAYEPLWMQLAMEAPSTGAGENYQWLGDVPGMSEWVDTKTLKRLRGFNYLILNKNWESTIEVDRNHVDDDQLGMYKPRIIELGENAKQHPDELVSSARKSGTSTACYDGKNFYATDHAFGMSGSHSNLLAGTGVTAAKVRDDLFAMRAAFRKFKSDQGKPFIRKRGNLDFIAVIPPDLEKVFDELNNPSPGSTVPKTPIVYEIDPYLTDANDWYLDYKGAPVRAFILQMRARPGFVSLENPNTSDTVFLLRKLLFGVEARYNVGYGLWQYSIKTTNA